MRILDFTAAHIEQAAGEIKHFDAYTHSVVRRIDEHVITKR